MTTQRSRSVLLAIALVSAGIVLPASSNEARPTPETPTVSDVDVEAGPVSTPAPSVTETANATTTPSDVQHLSFGDARATVFFNCTHFWITVTPADREYSLVLTYFDPESEQRFEVPTGALVGKSSDPFGKNGLLLLEVEARVLGRPSVSVYLPSHCRGAPFPARRGSHLDTAVAPEPPTE